jgi:hypothetical protein
VTKFTNQHGREFNINWEAPWRRIDMITGLVHQFADNASFLFF